ncbi:hypothetical protein Trydic_g2245 [Trypoxylus dichotomus]
MVLAKKYIYVKPFDGMPTSENVKIVEEELPELKDGEYLVEAVYLSVDPYMRAYAPNYKVGDTMIGTQVAKIIQSKSGKFPVGKYVVGGFGWRTYTIRKDSISSTEWNGPYIIDIDEELSLSLALGILGMPGNTAYFGLLEICKPQPGETVVVSGAAGAVGSVVGQIAKIKGCRVVGIAGSDEKSEWLKSIGFDAVINYKTEDLRQALAKAAPKRVDCYFDNVGGETSSIVLQNMNKYGRIAVCGAISGYLSKDMTQYPKATIVQRPMITFELTMRGFYVNQFLDRWQEAIAQNQQWIKEGKLKYRETVYEGFDNMLKGLVGVLKGENIGKAIVKI